MATAKHQDRKWVSPQIYNVGNCFMLRATSLIRNCAVQAIDGRIGSVSDLLFDTSSWKVRWLVVDTGGWLTGRKVLIHPTSLGEPDESRDRLYVEMTRDQINKSPGILSDPPVSQQMQEPFQGYNGWDGFGDYQSYAAGSLDYPVTLPPLLAGGGSTDSPSIYAGADPHDPNLRSATAIAGYHISAVDGEIGHLEELLVDDADWAVRYLIIETRNWLQGARIMLAPLAVVEIDWLTRMIYLNITRDQVKASPPAWRPGAETPTEPKRT